MRVYLRLTEAQYDALLDLSEREFRSPQQQAAWLITDELKRPGALPTDWTPNLPPIYDHDMSQEH